VFLITNNHYFTAIEDSALIVINSRQAVDNIGVGHVILVSTKLEHKDPPMIHFWEYVIALWAYRTEMGSQLSSGDKSCDHESAHRKHLPDDINLFFCTPFQDSFQLWHTIRLKMVVFQFIGRKDPR
jgi:hypothetical protein